MSSHDWLGVNPRTLRYYERIGLLAPSARTEAGYRLYSDQDADRLAFIRRAQTLGSRSRRSPTSLPSAMAAHPHAGTFAPSLSCGSVRLTIR